MKKVNKNYATRGFELCLGLSSFYLTFDALRQKKDNIGITNIAQLLKHCSGFLIEHDH